MDEKPVPRRWWRGMFSVCRQRRSTPVTPLRDRQHTGEEHTMIHRRRMLAGGASVLAAALALTACSGGGEGGSDDGPITWMSLLHTPTTPDPDGEIHQQLEEVTGADFEIQWVPAASSTEKVNAALSAGELPDIIFLDNIRGTTVRNALTSGMFWDVEPYLSEFDNLAQIPEATIDVARVDGGLY